MTKTTQKSVANQMRRKRTAIDTANLLLNLAVIGGGLAAVVYLAVDSFWKTFEPREIGKIALIGSIFMFTIAFTLAELRS